MTQRMANSNSIQQIEQFTSQIVQFLTLLETFYQTLSSETQALKTNNTEKISEIIPVKHQLSEQLSQKTQAIESLLQAETLTLATVFTPEFSSQLSSSLRAHIQKVIELSTQCQNLNQSNGISIQILSNINQHAINLVSGKETSNVKLYSASGETHRSTNTNPPIGKA
ncbi:hypothetical protein MNBD_GAMMA03-1642 [hydrothermal vent metagenome]|uniref:Flagellar biosynthesis protein FlgN n=1 Tax=hydrothermal vent metagenome TaxID=652676 RepID=A0A3B0WR79_9ZZZZ